MHMKKKIRNIIFEFFFSPKYIGIGQNSNSKLEKVDRYINANQNSLV